MRSIRELNFPTDQRQGREDSRVNRCRDEMDYDVRDADALHPAQETRVIIKVAVSPFPPAFRARVVAVAMNGSEPDVVVPFMVGIDRRFVDVQPGRLHVRRRKGEDHKCPEDAPHVLPKCRLGAWAGQRGERGPAADDATSA